MPPMAIWVVNMIIHKFDTPSDAGTSCQPQPKPFRLRVPNNKQQAPQRQTSHFPNPQPQGLMVEVAFDGLDCQKFPESGRSAAVHGAVRSQTVQVQRGWWIGVGLCIFRGLPQVLVPKKLCNEKIIQNWMQMGKFMLITGGILGKLFGSFASTNFIPCDNDQQWSMISLKWLHLGLQPEG